jgi:hypothetical protein
MITAFIGGGGGGAVIILLLIAVVLITLFSVGILLIAFRRRWLGTFTLLLFALCLVYIYLATRPIDYHEFSTASVLIDSSTGIFEVELDGIVRVGTPANLRDSKIILTCDGVSFSGTAHAVFIDQGERERWLFKYSIHNIEDSSDFRQFLKKGFQVDSQDQDGSIQRGDFTFTYTTRIDGAQDFQITKLIN